MIHHHTLAMDECCKFPNICVSGKICSNVNKKIKCCWHMDDRIDKNIIYVDGYGYIDPTYYLVKIPCDLYYCPTCKISEVSATEQIEELKKILPPIEEWKKLHKKEKIQHLKTTKIHRKKIF